MPKTKGQVQQHHPKIPTKPPCPVPSAKASESDQNLTDAVSKIRDPSPPVPEYLSYSIPMTVAGTLLFTVVPSPNCPAEFSPQHLTVPPATAHIWAAPAAIAVTPVKPEI